MADILIRGVHTEALSHIDREASARGLSRNQYLVEQLHSRFGQLPRPEVTLRDLERSADACEDLLAPDILAQAWR